WIDTASPVRAERTKIANASVAAKNALRNAIIEVPEGGTTAWRVMPLRATDAARIEDMSRYDGLPTLPEGLWQQLGHLVNDVPAFVRDAQTALGLRRFFS